MAERLTIPQTHLQSLIDSYSGDVISDGQIRAPVEFNGRLYVMTGGRMVGVRDDFEWREIWFCEAVPRNQYGGVVHDWYSVSRDGYEGVAVAFGDVEFVLHGKYETTEFPIGKAVSE